MAYLLALKTPQNVPITGESTCTNKVEVEILAKKKPCVSFFFKRGRITDRWEMYEMTVICLDGSKKKMQVSFFSSIFYEMVYEMRETHRKKKWAAGQNFYGEIKAWRVGLCGSGNFTLSPRYKVQGVHDRERDLIFI